MVRGWAAAAALVMALAAAADVSLAYRSASSPPRAALSFGPDGARAGGSAPSLPPCPGGWCSARLSVSASSGELAASRSLWTTEGRREMRLALPPSDGGPCLAEVASAAVAARERLAFHEAIECDGGASSSPAVYELILEGEPRPAEASASVRCLDTGLAPVGGTVYFTVRGASTFSASAACQGGEASVAFPATVLQRGVNSLTIDPEPEGRAFCLDRFDPSSHPRYLSRFVAFQDGRMAAQSYLASLDAPVAARSAASSATVIQPRALARGPSARSFSFGCAELGGSRGTTGSAALGTLGQGAAPVYIVPVVDGCGGEATLRVPGEPTGRAWLGGARGPQAGLDGYPLALPRGSGFSLVALEGGQGAQVRYYAGASGDSPLGWSPAYFSAYVAGEAGLEDPLGALSKGKVLMDVPNDAGSAWCVGVEGIQECPPSDGFTETHTAAELDGRTLAVDSYGGNVSMTVTCALSSTPRTVTVNGLALSPGTHAIPYREGPLSVSADRAGRAELLVTVLSERTASAAVTAAYDAPLGAVRYAFTVPLAPSDAGSWVAASVGLDEARLRRGASSVRCGAASLALNYSSGSLTLSPSDLAACAPAGGASVELAASQCLPGACPACASGSGGRPCLLDDGRGVSNGICCGGRCVLDRAPGSPCGSGECRGRLACDDQRGSWYCSYPRPTPCCNATAPGVCDARGSCDASRGAPCQSACLADVFVTRACSAGSCVNATRTDCAAERKACTLSGCVSCRGDEDCPPACTFRGKEQVHVRYSCREGGCVANETACREPRAFCSARTGCRGCAGDGECRDLWLDQNYLCLAGACADTCGDGERQPHETCSSCPADFARCDDSNPCTADSCGADGRCAHTNASCGAPCQAGDAAGACDGQGSCGPASGEGGPCRCGPQCAPGLHCDPSSRTCRATVCGDGLCQGECSSCPRDCRASDCAGNGACDAAMGESCLDADCPCPAGAVCGPVVGAAEGLDGRGCALVRCGDGRCEGPEAAPGGRCCADCGCPSDAYRCDAASGACALRTCGDGLCDAPLEASREGACCADCGCGPSEACGGDGACARLACGDGTCVRPHEDEARCCLDCGCPAGKSCVGGSCSAPSCGDGLCGSGEGCLECPKDCPCGTGRSCSPSAKLADDRGCAAPVCGDGECLAGLEDERTCCVDCGCGEGESCERGVCLPRCGDGLCIEGETREGCCQDCGCGPGRSCREGRCSATCGDGACVTGEEDAQRCCRDCPCPEGLECTAYGCAPSCGDGLCVGGEGPETCCPDCPCPSGMGCDLVSRRCLVSCGDGTCEPQECRSCPQDCSAARCAGNGACELRVGEDCANSPDCSCQVTATLTEPEVRLREGEEKLVLLDVENAGDASDTVSVLATGPEDVLGWKDMRNVLLEPNSTRQYGIKLKGARAGRFPVTVRVKRALGPDAVAALELVVEAKGFTERYLGEGSLLGGLFIYKDVLEVLFYIAAAVGAWRLFIFRGKAAQAPPQAPPTGQAPPARGAPAYSPPWQQGYGWYRQR